MPFRRIIIGVIVFIGLLCVCMEGYQLVSACCTPAAQTADGSEMLTEAVEEDADEKVLPVVIDIQKENGEPVLTYNGEPLSLDELKDFIRDLLADIKEQPVLFRAAEELTEQQWEDIIGSCCDDIPAFDNYGIEAPDRHYPYREISLAQANAAAEANAHPDYEYELVFNIGPQGEGVLSIVGAEGTFTESGFAARMKELAAADPRTRVYLIASCDVPWIKTNELIITCKEAGLLNATLTVECGPEQEND